MKNVESVYRLTSISIEIDRNRQKVTAK